MLHNVFNIILHVLQHELLAVMQTFHGGSEKY